MDECKDRPVGGERDAGCAVGGSRESGEDGDLPDIGEELGVD